MKLLYLCKEYQGIFDKFGLIKKNTESVTISYWYGDKFITLL